MRTTLWQKKFIYLFAFFAGRVSLLIPSFFYFVNPRCVSTHFKTKTMTSDKFFPDIITGHPSADIPIDGVKSNLIQAGQQQFIFMQFNKDIEVPEHSHEAQWGVVLDGTIELTIAGQKKKLSKGDTYFIDKDVRHSAKIRKGYADLTLFNQSDRYKVKK